MKHSVRKIKTFARANLMGNYRMAMQAFMLAVMIPMIIDSVYSFVEGDNVTASLVNDVIFYAVEFIILVISAVLSMGQIRIHLGFARHEETESGDLFYCFTHCSNHFFLGAIIRVLISLLASLPLLGVVSILDTDYKNLTSPNIITIIALLILALILNLVTLLMLHPFYYLLVEFNDMPLLFALKESVRLMRGNAFRLLHLYLSFIGMLLLCVISMGVGTLWVNPYMDQSLAVFYLDVIEETAEWKIEPQGQSRPQAQA